MSAPHGTDRIVRPTNGLRLLAAEKRHDGHRSAVLLMVVVERVVPPTTVLYLKWKQDVREVILEIRTLGGGQQIDAQRGVPMAVVIEVAGDVKKRLVRDG